MEIKGKIVEVQQTVQVTESFQKREFVVEYAENPEYPEFLKFELIQDKCSLMDNYKPADDVKVQFNLKGRKWKDKNGDTKYFNSLQAWKIESAEEGSTPPPQQEDWSQDPNDKDVLPF